MKYYIDTEFNEFFTNPVLGKAYHVVDLISIGIVAEDGREYYAIRRGFDVSRAWGKGGGSDLWVRDNVLMPIFWELSLDEKKGSYENWLDRNKHTGDAHLEALKYLVRKFGKSDNQIADEIKAFVGSGPEFYGYYADYDWVTFCSLFGRMIDLPKEFPMYCRDLKQIFDQKTDNLWWLISFRNGDSRLQYGHPDHGNHIDKVVQSKEEMVALLKGTVNYPKQVNEHNALADARWNKDLHQFIFGL